MYKITELLLEVSSKSDVEDDDGKMYDIMNRNVGHTIRFLSIAIHNSDSEPPAWLVKALDTQFNMDQLQAMSKAAYRRLGIQPFFGIMGLLRNQELNLIDTQETPAHSQPSAELPNTTDGQ